MDIIVNTPRLKLFALTRDMAEGILEDTKTGFRQVHSRWPTQDTIDILPFYIMDLKENPEVLGWGIWAIVSKADDAVVGVMA